MTNKSVDIIYQNVRGLRTKLTEFHNSVATSNAHLFAITETGCNESIYDSEMVPPGFTIIRCDRADGRKQGGACLVATPGTQMRQVAVPNDVNIDALTFELVCAAIYQRNKLLFLLCVVYLPPNSNENLDLILVYHSCDQSAEVSKQVLDLHYTLRTLFTNFFKDRVVDDSTERTLHTVLLQPLESRSRNGDAIFYTRLLDCDPKNLEFSKTLRSVLMILDLWQYEEGTWPGFELIFDLEGLRLGHLARLDVQSIQQFLYYLQETMLVKIKGFHFFNAPSFMDRLMLMLKPFMKKELMDVLRIHPIGVKTLDQYVPLEALPKGAIGGQYKSLEQCRDETLARLNANKEFFLAENKKRVVESLRPGKPKTISDIFGSVEGSFKKLDID